jgi:hypothetical protein
MPGWIENVATRTELDVAGAPKYSFESTDSIVANFDKNVAPRGPPGGRRRLDVRCHVVAQAW